MIGPALVFVLVESPSNVRVTIVAEKIVHHLAVDAVSLLHSLVETSRLFDLELDVLMSLTESEVVNPNIVRPCEIVNLTI